MVILGQQLWNGLITGMAYVLFSMGLTLIFGTLGVINMAHGELYMLGAMVCWTLITYLNLSFFPSMLLSVVIVGLFGVAFNRIAVTPLRESHPLSIMLSTMAVSFTLMYASMIVWNVDTRTIATPFKGTYYIWQVPITQKSLALFLIGTVALVFVYLFLNKSNLGKEVRATAQDNVGAQLIGINVKFIFAFTMAFAAALAALAGTIIGPIWVAYPSMGQDMLLKGFAVVIIGGMGNLVGCVVVGLLLGIAEALFSQYISMYYNEAFAFGLVVLMCLVRPQGLFNRS